MANPMNPYAAPNLEGAVVRTDTGGVSRDGDTVVIPIEGAVFPARCVVCNEPANKRLMRRLYWHPPGYYLLIFISLLIYAIAALIVRKRATFEIGLCDKHHSRRRAGILIGWLGFFLGLIGFVLLIDSVPVAALVLALVMIVGPVAGVIMTNQIRAKKIDKEYAWLTVGRPFLDSL